MHRMFLSLITVAIIGLFAGAHANAQEAPSKAELLKPAPNPAWNRFSVAGSDIEELYPGFYTFRYTGTRNIFLVTEEGVIATDPVNEEVAKAYREAIRSVTDQPIKYVVYSHDHWDHVEGGKLFQDEGAQIIAHKNCVPSFYDIPNSKIALPDITFSDDYVIELGGRKLELLYFGPNHSDCLVVMRPDDSEYLFIVDLVTPGGTPLSYMADYYPQHMIRTLKEIEKLDFTYMIPGHGVPIADRSAVTERRQYLEDLMAAVEVEFNAVDRNLFADIKPKVRQRMETWSYLRNYERNIDANIERVMSYYGIGW